METESLSYGVAGAQAAEALNLMVQSALIAEKTVCWLLFLIGFLPNNIDALTNLLESEKRFPFSDLEKVSAPDDECKDNGETEDDSDDDDDDEDVDGDDDSDNDDDDSSEEENDDQAGPDSDDSDSDDDDEDDDDDDEDDDDEDDDDDEEDEYGENQPPCKKKK